MTTTGLSRPGMPRWHLEALGVKKQERWRHAAPPWHVPRRGPAGFSLVELLLVVGIFLVLAAIFWTTTGPVKKVGQVARCMAHLRQIGIAYQMYREDYGAYPDPRAITLGPSLLDRRLLFCPEDRTIMPLGAASSYRFRATVPPDFIPLAGATDVDPNIVLIGCAHHLGQREVVLKGDNTRLTPPVYPFHLVLRAGGQVERIPLSRVRQFFQKEDRPVLRTLYPGEPGYEDVRRPPRPGSSPKQEPHSQETGRTGARSGSGEAPPRQEREQ
jgi:prepilin-type N-terminal cleavage/methylation domain-containing protein